MDRGAWQDTVHGVSRVYTAEQLKLSFFIRDLTKLTQIILVLVLKKKTGLIFIIDKKIIKSLVCLFFSVHSYSEILVIDFCFLSESPFYIYGRFRVKCTR